MNDFEVAVQRRYKKGGPSKRGENHVETQGKLEP